MDSTYRFFLIPIISWSVNSAQQTKKKKTDKDNNKAHSKFSFMSTKVSDISKEQQKPEPQTALCSYRHLHRLMLPGPQLTQWELVQKLSFGSR